MHTIKVNTNRVDIPFTKNNTLQFTDVSALVSPDAVGVLLEERNNDIGNRHVIGKSLNDLFLGQEQQLNFESYGTHIVGFHLIQGKILFLRGFDSTSSIYIRAELFAPDFVFRSMSNLQSLQKTFVDGQVNQWVDKTVTAIETHSISDVAGVIITRNTNSAPVDWGIRTKGSTAPFVTTDLQFGSAGTDVVGVDSNGQYQLYAGGKDGDPDTFNAIYWETGYILKNGMSYITNPVNENVADTGGVYSDLDLSGTVEPASTHAFLSWRNGTTIPRLGHARPTGSTDPNTSMHLSDKARTTGIVSLTDAGLAEYMTNHAGATLFVQAYFKESTPSVTAVNIKGNNLLVRGCNLLIK